MTDQQFCLRWNNHQSTLISVFDTLLENGTLVDCTLAAEGQYLKAHKVVLSACSPYLETLLSQHYEKHPIVILKDVKFTELKSMMDYMYRGEVNISQDQLGTFLKAAESLQIKGLSENGEGDARDVGSTQGAKPQAARKTPANAATQQQRPEAAESPANRDGSISPTSRKRRRIRRSSDDDNHLDANSCDLPSQAQSTPIVPNIPASITSTPIKPPIVKPEVNDRIMDHNSLPPESGLLKEKIEPAEPLLEPKTEYLEDLNNDDSVEDLTLDDDDEMDMSQMSNMSNISRPGPSHGADLSNQGFAPWQLGNQSGTDEVFMAAQEAVNAQRDSQDKSCDRILQEDLDLTVTDDEEEDTSAKEEETDLQENVLDSSTSARRISEDPESKPHGEEKDTTAKEQEKDLQENVLDTAIPARMISEDPMSNPLQEEQTNLQDNEETMRISEDTTAKEEEADLQDVMHSLAHATRISRDPESKPRKEEEYTTVKEQETDLQENILDSAIPARMISEDPINKPQEEEETNLQDNSMASSTHAMRISEDPETRTHEEKDTTAKETDLQDVMDSLTPAIRMSKEPVGKPHEDEDTSAKEEETDLKDGTASSTHAVRISEDTVIVLEDDLEEDTLWDPGASHQTSSSNVVPASQIQTDTHDDIIEIPDDSASNEGRKVSSDLGKQIDEHLSTDEEVSSLLKDFDDESADNIFAKDTASGSEHMRALGSPKTSKFKQQLFSNKTYRPLKMSRKLVIKENLKIRPRNEHKITDPEVLTSDDPSKNDNFTSKEDDATATTANEPLQLKPDEKSTPIHETSNIVLVAVSSSEIKDPNANLSVNVDIGNTLETKKKDKVLSLLDIVDIEVLANSNLANRVVEESLQDLPDEMASPQAEDLAVEHLEELVEEPKLIFEESSIVDSESNFAKQPSKKILKSSPKVLRSSSSAKSKEDDEPKEEVDLTLDVSRKFDQDKENSENMIHEEVPKSLDKLRKTKSSPVTRKPQRKSTPKKKKQNGQKSKIEMDLKTQSQKEFLKSLNLSNFKDFETVLESLNGSKKKKKRSLILGDTTDEDIDQYEKHRSPSGKSKKFTVSASLFRSKTPKKGLSPDQQEPKRTPKKDTSVDTNKKRPLSGSPTKSVPKRVKDTKSPPFSTSTPLAEPLEKSKTLTVKQRIFQDDPFIPLGTPHGSRQRTSPEKKMMPKPSPKPSVSPLKTPIKNHPQEESPKKLPVLQIDLRNMSPNVRLEDIVRQSLASMNKDAVSNPQSHFSRHFDWSAKKSSARSRKPRPRKPAVDVAIEKIAAAFKKDAEPLVSEKKPKDGDQKRVVKDGKCEDHVDTSNEIVSSIWSSDDEGLFKDLENSKVSRVEISSDELVPVSNVPDFCAVPKQETPPSRILPPTYSTTEERYGVGRLPSQDEDMPSTSNYLDLRSDLDTLPEDDTLTSPNKRDASRQLECEYCELTFQTMRQLNYHNNVYHTSKSLFF